MLGQKTSALRWHGDMHSHTAEGIPTHRLEELREVKWVMTHAGAWPGHRGLYMPVQVERLAKTLGVHSKPICLLDTSLHRPSSSITVPLHYLPGRGKCPHSFVGTCIVLGPASGPPSSHLWAGGPGRTHLTTTAGYDRARCSTSSYMW